MNRRLVELWRSRRPPGGFSVESKDSMPQYLAQAGVNHISGAWETDWLNDAQAIEWLSDFPGGKQDLIPVLAAQALGAERTAELAKAAESAGDWWLASLRWSASAESQHILGSYRLSLPLMVESARTLEHVDAREEKDQLELRVLFQALFSYMQSIDVAGYSARMFKVVEAMGSAVDSLTLLRAIHFVD